MYIIYNETTGKYYTGNGWNELKLAMKLTRPRAEELAESMNIASQKNWEGFSGTYVVLEHDTTNDRRR